MITKVSIENFKRLDNIEFNLSQSVVIIGPNNSGKSTIFQALCLWEIGVKSYLGAYAQNDLNRQGAATINRKDLLNSPISDARFLWNNKKVTQKSAQGKGQTHIPLVITLYGNSGGNTWDCKVQFTFLNAESFSCEIISGLEQIKNLYENNNGVHFGFLQPMSGISTAEDWLTKGSVERKLGEGKTAEVLRNICYTVLNPELASQNQNEDKWDKLCIVIKKMFGVELQKPEYIKATGLISLEYVENKIKYDISSGGRGFLQSLLLFAYMYANPGTKLLLDEPDAHLEVIRQREAFHQIVNVAKDTNSQVLIASHSEVVLDEAADTSKVIALIQNQTIELNSDTNQQSIRYIRKALTEIGWEKYYLAKSKGHVLYLEGSTDLQMLLKFANKLKHKVEPLLRVANVTYTSDNVPVTAINNYVSLKEIFPQLKGLALFDNIPQEKLSNPKLKMICWEKRELENYFARPSVLETFAGLLANKYSTFSSSEMKQKMQESIRDNTIPKYLNNVNDDWWNTAKLSDDWMDKIFPDFYAKIGMPQDFFKRDYCALIDILNRSTIDDEITDKLDEIYNLLNNN